MVNLTQFTDKAALKECQKEKSSDLNPESFSCSRLWQVLDRHPATKDKPEYIDLDSTINHEFLNDDDRLLEIVKMFKFQSEHILV